MLVFDLNKLLVSAPRLSLLCIWCSSKRKTLSWSFVIDNKQMKLIFFVPQKFVASWLRGVKLKKIEYFNLTQHGKVIHFFVNIALEMSHWAIFFVRKSRLPNVSDLYQLFYVGCWQIAITSHERQFLALSGSEWIRKRT